jgi:hypothetical protein
LEGNSEATLRLGSYQVPHLRGFLNQTPEMASSGLCSAQTGNKLTNSVAAINPQHPCRDCNNFHGGVFYSCAYLNYMRDRRPLSCHRTTAQKTLGSAHPGDINIFGRPRMARFRASTTNCL